MDARGQGTSRDPLRLLAIAWKDDRKIVVLAGLACIIVLIAIIGPSLAPYDPLATDYSNSLLAPTATHPFGCDKLGRDVLSRILSGARITIFMSMLAAFITMGIGIIVGVMAGFLGGLVDTVLMRISDTFMAFPEVVLGIAIAGALGPGMGNAVIAVCVVMWVRFARLARGLALSLRESEFLFTARLSGCGWPRIIFRHLIPNILPQMFAAMLLEIGYIMLTLAAFSFLGLGVQPPFPEWGAMLSEGRDSFLAAPYLMLFPGLAIFMTVAVFNLFGNAVNDRLVGLAGERTVIADLPTENDEPVKTDGQAETEGV